MRTIEIDDDIYEHLCRHTSEIGEPASSILRRLLALRSDRPAPPAQPVHDVANTDRAKDLGSTPAKSGTTSARVAMLLSRLAKLRTKQVVDRFIPVLAWIHEQEPNKFECAKQIRGRKRVYFSRRKQDIEDSAKSTYPVEIPGTGWFVSTNNSTDNKRAIIDELLCLLHFSRQEREDVVEALDPGSMSPLPSSLDRAADFIADEDDLRI